jgi:hypothetical protein
MYVFKEAFWGYGFDPVKFFDFEKFSSEAEDYVLAIGFINLKFLNKVKDKNVIMMMMEEPNGFFGSPELFLVHDYLNIVKKIFTICPYSAEWSNKTFPGNKWEFAFYPFNADNIPTEKEKVFDFIYTGQQLEELKEVKMAASHFKACWVSFNPGQNITHANVSYEEKLNLCSLSKIAVVHNLLFPGTYSDNYRKSNLLNKYRNHEALSQITDTSYVNPLVPQVKSRMMEAAFCKSLILCRKDPWNLIERFFEPEKEFIYYENGKLYETIQEILKNYDKYVPIINAAYDRAVNNYTTRHYFNKYLKDLFR